MISRDRERSIIAVAPPVIERRDALFLDFDGTLAEIAPAPDLVHVAPRMLELLFAMEKRLGGALALVTGRAIDDLTRMMAPFRFPIAGQHGLERRDAAGRLLRSGDDVAISTARAALHAFVREHPALRLEDKGASLSLHYRQAPEIAGDCLRIVKRLVAESEGSLRLVEGRMVAEVVPVHAGKGGAIEAFLGEEPFRGRRPVFIGDDIGDEHGFELVEQEGGVSIRVGEGASIAPYRLASVADVHEWLARSLES